MKKNENVIIITGASSGIGAATARRLGHDGAHIVLAARRKEKLEDVAAEIERSGGEALVVQTDICKRTDIEHLVQTTLEHWGRIDVLVNNAGIANNAPLFKMDPEVIHQGVHVNLLGVIECTQAVLPVMLRQRSGHIVNVSSLAGVIATPDSPVYSATKFGVNGFSDALRREVRRDGIFVSAFCPGYTPSELSPALQAHENTSTDAPYIPGLMPTAYVAEQLVCLIYSPRRRLIIPISWRPLITLGRIFPGFADQVLSSKLYERAVDRATQKYQ